MRTEIEALVARSNRLGSDRRITNYAGGNTSAKVTLRDPITGEDTEVLAVKGTGGDLGTLTEAGLAFLRLDRLLALERLYDAGTSEEDLVAYYADCGFGPGGAVPSIDTPLHAFVAQRHVDHLHPDAMIAIAASKDGPALTGACYGDEVAWIDWKRPGFELGLALRELQRERPDAVGAVMGGHGMICWAEDSDECEGLSQRLIARAAAFVEERCRSSFVARMREYEPLSDHERRDEAAELAPLLRGLASTDQLMVGCFEEAPVVLDFLASEAASRLAPLGTSCPDHFLRTKVRPLLLDLGPRTPLSQRVERLKELHAEYRRDYAAYYKRYADDASPPMRGADPAIFLVPGVGMFSFGADAHTARIAGEFYINAINVMRGAEAISTYAPIDDREKFRIEYWELEERKLRLRPPPRPLQGRVAVVTGGGSGIGLAISERLADEGACVAILDLDDESAGKATAALGTDRAIAIRTDVSDESAVGEAFAEVARRFGGVDLVVNNAGFAVARSATETTVEEWDRLHGVLARGAFLVSRAAARQMIEQRIGGDIVYIVSKNAIVAGPANVAYGSAKADQAHQVRLLAAELGPHMIRVNGVNPDGVVRGSGIFSGEWLEARAEAYGVAPDELGRFYAKRTLLGEEVLPEHVASAVFVLVAGELSRTTGTIIPVDGGLPEAFLR